MPTDSRKIALITGASSGIGADLARAFAASGHNVILTARRQDRLAALAAELGPTARVIVEDLADPAAPARLLAAAGRIDVLVNNAGFGAGGRIAALPLDRQLGIIQVNVTALTALTRLALPDMLARRHGRILNVASVVSFLPCPGLAVYAASKAYVLSFSEALGEELRGSGVTVTCLCPGSTTSEFTAVAGMSGRRDLPFVMSAAAVARQGHDATLAGRHLIVTGTPNRMVDLATRLLPRTLLLRLAGRAVDRG